jgi:DNA-binding transcriptional ArsR family regulator
MTRLMDLLADPVRSRIYFEVMRQGETTANHLMQHVAINRSTLTHHLTKLVEAKALLVRVQELGRPIKYYRLNEDIEDRLVIEGDDDSVETLQKRIAFLESAIAHLQMITNLAHESVSQRRQELALKEVIRKKTKPKSRKRTLRQVCFTFLLLNDEGVRIWNQEYDRFVEKVEDMLREQQRSNQSNTQSRHIAFAGLFPITKGD